MKFYIHKDHYFKDEWWRSFEISCKRKNLEYHFVDLLADKIKMPKIKNDDWLLARFGHRQDDKKKISQRYSKIFDRFNGNVFPNKKAYELYDNKWRQYKFLKKHNIQTPPTGYVINESDISNFLVRENVEFPVVTKKIYGAGGQYVDKWNSLEEIPNHIFPCIVQPYIDTKKDIRLTILNDVFVSHKRKFFKDDRFPYGGKWFETTVLKVDDELNHFHPDFLKNLWNLFVNHLEMPTVGIDLVVSEEDEPFVLEFSYCFAHHIATMSSHLYKFPSFDRVDFRKNEKIHIPTEKRQTLTTDKIIEFIQNEKVT